MLSLSVNPERNHRSLAVIPKHKQLALKLMLALRMVGRCYWAVTFEMGKNGKAATDGPPLATLSPSYSLRLRTAKPPPTLHSLMDVPMTSN